MTYRQPQLDQRGPGNVSDGATRSGPQASSDSRLVQRAVALAKEGDSEGLHFLYVRYASEVLAYAANFVQDDREAEEVMEGVFRRLVTAIRDCEQKDIPFTAWTLSARKAALDQIRAKGLIPPRR